MSFAIGNCRYNIGEGAVLTINGVTYVGGQNGSVSVHSNGGNFSNIVSSVSNIKLSGNIMTDLRQTNGSTQINIIETWIKNNDVTAQQLLEMIQLVQQDTYKVDFLKVVLRTKIVLNIGDVKNILQSIKSATYQTDAIQYLIQGFQQIDAQDAVTLLQTIRADTYVVDALKEILSRLQMEAKDIAMLCRCAQSDTYKIDILKILPRMEQISRMEISNILQCLRSDTYKIDAVKVLSYAITPSWMYAIEHIASDTYKANFSLLLKSCIQSISTQSLLDMLQNISNTYKKDIIKQWLSKLEENNIELLLDIYNQNDLNERNELLWLLLKQFPHNDHLKILHKDTQEKIKTAKKEDCYSILINGYKVNVEHWPIGVNIDVRFGNQDVQIQRTNTNGIRVDGSKLFVEQVPFSNIRSIEIIGGSLSGDLVVGAGNSMSVCSSAFGTSYTTFEKGKPFETSQSWNLFSSAKNVIQKLSSIKDNVEIKEVVEVKKPECVICLSEPAVGVFVPCGHQSACIDCGNAIDSCPLCRGKGAFMHISLIDQNHQRIYL